MKYALHIGTLVLIFLSRFGILLPNFSPLGSYGFFGRNLVLYFGSILLFDVITGGFYQGFLFTYFGFAAYYLLGKMSKGKLAFEIRLLPIASLLFFVISNFGVWLYWYPYTLEGLISCYVLAIPFFTNTFVSDLIFGYGFLAVREAYRRSENLNALESFSSK